MNLSDWWRVGLIVAAGLIYFTSSLWIGWLRGLTFKRRAAPQADLIGLLSQVRAEAARHGEDWTDQLRPLVQRAWEIRKGEPE